MDTQTVTYETGDPAFGVNRRGDVVYWNTPAERTFGFSDGKALGQKCWELLSGQDTYGNRYCDKHCPIRKMAFRHEPVNNFQSVYETASEDPRLFSVSCLTIFEEPRDGILMHICHEENTLEQPARRPAPARPPASNHLGELSPRELEILTLLAGKMSTQDIATAMSISIRTVRTHIQHLMYKLQVHKRAEAVEVGHRLKLI